MTRQRWTHNAWHRRLARRLPLRTVPAIVLIGAGLALLAQPLYVLLWLSGQHGFVEVRSVSRWIWLGVCFLVGAPFTAYGILTPAQPSRAGRSDLRALGLGIAQLSAAIALVYRRVDVAVYLTLGGEALWRVATRVIVGPRLSSLARAATRILVAMGVAWRSPWIAAAGFLGTAAAAIMRDPKALAQTLRRKPTARAYVAQAANGERSEAGAGSPAGVAPSARYRRLRLLRRLCETERWAEARELLDRLDGPGTPCVVMTASRSGPDGRCAAVTRPRRPGRKRDRKDPTADLRLCVLLGERRYAECTWLASELLDRGVRCSGSLALALAGAGQTTRAMELARDAARRGDRGAALALGRLLAAEDQHPEALLWLERAGVGAESHRLMAESLMALGDYHEAAAALGWAVRRSPFRREEDVALLAECQRRCGRDREAEAIERVIAA